MLNPLNFLSKFIKSSNQKELDRFQKIVDQINNLENQIAKVDDHDFPEKNASTEEMILKMDQKLINFYLRCLP